MAGIPTNFSGNTLYHTEIKRRNRSMHLAAKGMQTILPSDASPSLNSRRAHNLSRQSTPLTVKRAWCGSKQECTTPSTARQQMSRHARAILHSKTPSGAPSRTQEYFVPATWLPRNDAARAKALKHAARSIKLSSTEPQFVTGPDPPYSILAVNDAWLKAVGLSRQLVLGSPPKILQGMGTEKQAIATLMRAVRARKLVTVCLTNYNQQRQPFENFLTVRPIVASGEPLFLATSKITYPTRTRLPQPPTGSRPRRQKVAERSRRTVTSRCTKLPVWARGARCTLRMTTRRTDEKSRAGAW